MEKPLCLKSYMIHIIYSYMIYIMKQLHEMNILTAYLTLIESLITYDLIG